MSRKQWFLLLVFTGALVVGVLAKEHVDVYWNAHLI